VLFLSNTYKNRYKIIRKVRRKITGVEKMAEAELKDR